MSVIFPDSSFDILLEYNSTELDTGSYSDIIHIQSNDVDIPDTSVFVFLTIVSPGYEYLPGDVNMAKGIWPPAVIGSDVTYLVNYFKGSHVSQSCLLDGFWASADANGDCIVMGSDVIKMVNYFRGNPHSSISYCPEYEPCWPPIPDDAPSGWPNCETLPVTGKVLPAGNSK